MPVALVLAYYFAVGVPIDPVNAVWSFLNIVVFHAAGNVWSDAFDYLYGVDNQNTHGVRLLVDGKFTAREFIWFAVLLFAVGTLSFCCVATRLAVLGCNRCRYCSRIGLSAFEVSSGRRCGHFPCLYGDAVACHRLDRNGELVV